MKRFKLKVGIDVDDILYSCNEYAISLANAQYNYNPPLTIDELTGWGPSGKRTDVLLDYYKEPYFVKTQPVIVGAKEFINKLSQIAEIFFITAVSPETMSSRATRLVKDFPVVPKENIIMGARKDMVKVDILLDDGAHNITMSNSTYPVLMRKPWNRHMTGCLAVNDFDEFMTLVHAIQQSTMIHQLPKGNKVIGLVGPSASGKTELLNMLVRDGKAVRSISYTTRKKRDTESDGDYFFISRDEFKEKEGDMFETTSYAGELYGCSKEQVSNGLISNNVIMAIDICGAIALKKAFPEQALLIFINRPKVALIKAILERNISNEDKTNRIISLSDEYKNEDLCDAVIHNDSTIEDSYAQLEEIVNSY